MSNNNVKVPESKANLNKKLNNKPISKEDIEYIKERLDKIYEIISKNKTSNTQNILGLFPFVFSGIGIYEFYKIYYE